MNLSSVGIYPSKVNVPVMRFFTKKAKQPKKESSEKIDTKEFLRRIPRTLSTFPMQFGSESQYRTALQEIEWLKSIGSLDDIEFSAISAKYDLPVSFLKAKLQFPHDYMIMLSDWWAILCSWAAQKRRMYRDLLDDYTERHNAQKLKGLVFVFGSLVGVVMVLIALNLGPFPTLKFNPFELFSFYIFPYVLTFAVVYYHSILYAREKDNKLRATINYAMDNGYGQMVNETARFVRQQIKMIGTALFFVKADVLFHRSAPEFYGYNFGKKPDGSPLVLAENPDEMCTDRIQKLQDIIDSEAKSAKKTNKLLTQVRSRKKSTFVIVPLQLDEGSPSYQFHSLMEQGLRVIELGFLVKNAFYGTSNSNEK